jgi:hypothetical protein
MKGIDLKVYLIVTRDVEDGFEMIHSVNDKDVDIRKLISNYLHHLTGHDFLLKPAELLEFKEKMQFLIGYDVKKVNTFVKGCFTFTSNGFFDIDVLEADFLTFKLNEFVQQRKNALNACVESFDFSEN